MRTVVCGIAFKERFSIEGEGVFMRRLFSCCASLALAIGGFAGGARAQIKNWGGGRGGGLSPGQPPRTWTPPPRARGISLHHLPPLGGRGGNRGTGGAP